MKKQRKQPEFKKNLNYTPKTEKYKSIIADLQNSIKKQNRNETIIYWSLVGIDILFVIMMAVFYHPVTAILLGLVFLIIPVFASNMIEKEILKKYSDLLDMINLDELDINNNDFNM